jgi:CBS domain-containing protein
MDPKKITAADIMNSDLLTLDQDTTIEDAIRTLEDYHISGAPVLNAAGECVGVLSATDVLKRESELEEGLAPRPGDYFSGAEALLEEADVYLPKEEYDPEILGRDTVGQWMTAEVLAVTPQTSIEQVCRKMVEDRVHRLLVMEDKQLKGIVSSFDIVRLLAGKTERPARRERKKARKASGR